MTLAVVDLGCHTHRRYPEDESLDKLVRRFAPYRLDGFDPHPEMAETVGRYFYRGTEVVKWRRAAATYDGVIAYDPRPDRPLAAATGHGPMEVACFDFARWLFSHMQQYDRVVVKMDVEGAEYELLPRLYERILDPGVELLLVEFHQPPIGPEDWEDRKESLLATLRCPVEEW